MAWGKKKESESIVLNSSFLTGRVLSVDQTTTQNNGSVLIETMGVWADLPEKTRITAYPFFPNIKSYPLKNEVVFLVPSFIGDYSSNTGKVAYYYFSSLNIWGNINANPTPNPFKDLKSSTQDKTLEEIEAGSPNISANSATTPFKPGTYFSEKDNIYPLYPFEGDVIIEGRFGNSIRFGSTNITYGSQNKENQISKNYEESIDYSFGDTTLLDTFKFKLSNLNNRISEFFLKYSNNRISVFIESSESQVTNPRNIARGELAKQRAKAVEDFLLTLSNLRNNITVNTQVGTTPYRRGVDNPNNPKYLQEQYTKVKVLIQATETTNQPSQPTALNNWSDIPENGDPITIIRNGQSNLLVPPVSSSTVENINNDVSSIYLTSTQQLPLTASSTNDYLSYGESEDTPEASNTYEGPQIVLNSGRLFFNTKGDHLMLSSAKSINLNANQSINLDTVGPITLQSSEIKLGSSDADESALLGDTTVELLQSLLSDLKTLFDIVGLQLGNNGILLEPSATTFRTLSNNIAIYQAQLDDLKSDIVKLE